MIGYVTLGTDDMARGCAYFDALLGSIGAKRLMEFPAEDGSPGFVMWGTATSQPGVCLTRPYDKQAANCGNGNMIALVMDSPERVDAFYAKAIELGGTDEGPPGYRGDPSFGYYFAYFRDPDGHKMAAFHIKPQA